MRVLHVASGREWRGGQNQVRLLTTALAGHDLTQRVVTTTGSRLERMITNGGVPVDGAPWRAGIDPRAAWTLLRSTRAFRAELVHAHDAHALTLALLTRVISPRVPLVVTRRVVWPPRHPAVWRRPEAVVAISEAVRTTLLTAGLDPERVIVVRSAVDLEALQHTVPANLRNMLGLPPSARIAVTVGHLSPEKDHGTLLAAARAVAGTAPELHWIIAGDGPLAATLARMARDLQVDDRVHLLGFVDDYRAIIAAGDVFVMSSVAEGLGTAAIEALGLGRPVVVTRAGGLAEVPGPDAGVVVPVRDPVALGQAVCSIAGDNERREAMGRAARVRAAAIFGIDSMADGMVAVYERVLRGTRLRGA